MMGLVRKTNSTYSQINRNLKILESEDIVTVKCYRRLKIIKLNKESEKTQTLLKALRMLGKPISDSRKPIRRNQFGEHF